MILSIVHSSWDGAVGGIKKDLTNNWKEEIAKFRSWMVAMRDRNFSVAIGDP